jgi:hypothetical protein
MFFLAVYMQRNYGQNCVYQLLFKDVLQVDRAGSRVLEKLLVKQHADDVKD